MNLMAPRNPAAGAPTPGLAAVAATTPTDTRTVESTAAAV